MASKYAFIVAATGTYTPELIACLNSLDYVGSEADVHVFGIDIEESIISQLDILSFRVIFHNVTEKEWNESNGKTEVVCRKRYWYAAEVGVDYQSVCILDADLIWVRDPFQFFVIAEKTGFILGPGKEQNKVYDDIHHQFNGEWILPKGFYNYKDMCNCPVFIDAKKYGEALRKSWEWFITGFPDTNFKASDMDSMNVAFIKYAGLDNIIVLPGIQWLGTNEQMLKPYVRAILDNGLIRTESGIPIYCYHGQYYHKSWRDCQLSNRHQCASTYLKADRHHEVIDGLDNQASGAMNLLYEYFKKMLSHKILIENKNYRHPGLALDE